MTDYSSPVIFLSGAGGGAPDLDVFRDGVDDATRFEVIGYPGWRRYVEDGFSAEGLIADLAAQIEKKVPHGPIRIVGLSIGGHFGYAVALQLQARGREIGGFCAIDTFIIASANPAVGWKGRALAEGWGLLRSVRIGEFIVFLRSKFWRALLRLGGNRLSILFHKLAASGQRPSLFAIDPILEGELSMRLLIREVAPWIATLDCHPIALRAPTTILRTESKASYDAAWRRRCPNIEIFEILGKHNSLFEPENIGSLREAFILATRHWR
jgi:thioesterase domain-containing protein